MEAYFPVKMKRKDLDEVNDDFSDFSLSSPATKIRRLDAELPPIIEEEETVNPVVFGQEVRCSPVAIDGLPENEERALVLFDPIKNMPSLQSRSPFSISVNSDWLSGFKNPVIWSNRADLLKSLEQEPKNQESDTVSTNGCLAVIPWVPKQLQHCPVAEMEPSQDQISEMMDADDSEAMSMDIEDDLNNFKRFPRNEMGSVGAGDGLNQWQQHCMVPQPPHNLSTRHLVRVKWLG